MSVDICNQQNWLININIIDASEESLESFCKAYNSDQIVYFEYLGFW